MGVVHGTTCFGAIVEIILDRRGTSVILITLFIISVVLGNTTTVNMAALRLLLVRVSGRLIILLSLIGLVHTVIGVAFSVTTIVVIAVISLLRWSIVTVRINWGRVTIVIFGVVVVVIIVVVSISLTIEIRTGPVLRRFESVVKFTILVRFTAVHRFIAFLGFVARIATFSAVRK